MDATEEYRRSQKSLAAELAARGCEAGLLSRCGPASRERPHHEHILACCRALTAIEGIDA